MPLIPLDAAVVGRILVVLEFVVEEVVVLQLLAVLLVFLLAGLVESTFYVMHPL